MWWDVSARNIGAQVFEVITPERQGDTFVVAIDLEI